MQVWNRLGIGTANWGKKYNGAKVSEKDQKEILDLCMCCGIDLIDTATAYENNVLDMASSYFKVIVKVRRGDNVDKILDKELCCLMAHNLDAIPLVEEQFDWGVSIYDQSEFDGLGNYWEDIDVIQMPYSIFDRRLTDAICQAHSYGKEVHVRSVFLRGKILEKVKPHEAIAFCLMNPYVDRVIFGVDSADQFKQNLDYFHWLDSMKCDDENIIDPRKWKEEL